MIMIQADAFNEVCKFGWPVVYSLLILFCPHTQLKYL